MNRIDRDDLDRTLDRALDAIRDENPDAAVVDDAAARVWDRLSREVGEPASDGALRSCDDFRALLPEYRAGTLSEARRLLLEDHSRECIPCRKALRAGRDAAPATAAPAARRRASRWSSPWMWAAAAVLALTALLVGYPLVNEAGGEIRIASVDGSLFQVADSGPVPVGSGDVFERGEPVRTAKESGAIVELYDGSRIEMNERSEMRVTRRGNDATVHLARGSIIIEASEQGSGHLFVRTNDCLVSVTGTVFSVNHGNRGSRVSVIEGEVEVDYARGLDILHPGQQISTAPNLGFVPIADEIAWSRNLDDHLALIKELTDIQREISDSLTIPGLRYSTRLLDAAPEGTIIYVGLPNLTETLSEAHRLFRDKVETSPLLRQWWEDNIVATGAEPELSAAIEKIRRFGEQLGDEIVVTLQHAPGDEPRGPVILAELDRPGQFRKFLDAEGDSLEVSPNGRRPWRIVEDPFAEAGAGAGTELLLLIRGKVLVAAPDITDLQHVASLLGRRGSGRFKGSEFHARLAETYRDGASIVFGADMATLLGDTMTEDDAKALGSLGLTDMQHIIVERHETGDRTVTRAVVSFGQNRSGVAAWLAEPGPMGTLDFVSADATAAAAFVVKTPASLLEDLLGTVGQNDADFASELERFESEHGIDLVADVAGPLGGEIALALDGPVLPKPAWKLVVEVYDQNGLQRTLEWAVKQANELAVEDVRAGVTLTEEQIGGRTYHTLRSETLDLEVHYTFVDGYVVFAPQRALIERSLQYRRSGYTLASSREFEALLPEDGRAHFSGLVYQNLGPVMDPMLQSTLARSAPLTEDQRATVEELAAGAEPSLFYVYGEADRIIVGGSDRAGLLGTNLAGGLHLGSILGIQESLLHAAEQSESGYHAE